ncbi:MAG: hypothetical protein KatS3mg054_0650 [Chloroflexus sp.]|nr:MAG: hypothetical protein KatS3mg054_0650 [Chloroflexus sp.]
MKILPDVVFFAGSMLLVLGVTLIYIPAGIIAAGVLLIVWSLLLAAAQQEDEEC